MHELISLWAVAGEAVEALPAAVSRAAVEGPTKTTTQHVTKARIPLLPQLHAPRADDRARY